MMMRVTISMVCVLSASLLTTDVAASVINVDLQQSADGSVQSGEGPAGGGGVWNQIDGGQAGTDVGGLLYAHGDAAVGVSVNVTNRTNSSSGAGVNGYAGGNDAYDPAAYADLLDDYFYILLNTGNRPGLISFSGLSAGMYDFYAYTSGDAAAQPKPYGVGVAQGTFASVGDAQAAASYALPAPSPGDMVDGLNYVKLANLVVGDDGLLVISYIAPPESVTAGHDNNLALLSGFSIALVPEPASLAVLGLGGLLMLNRRRQQILP